MSYELKREDVFGLASSIHADVREKGDELFFRHCPKCGGGDGKDRDTFSINLVSGAFKCFRAGCDYHGHFVELARDFGYHLDTGAPKIYRTLPQRPVETREAAITYLASRCISEEVARKYRVTADKRNEHLIVFPFYDDRDILRFIKYRNSNFKKGDQGSKEWCEKDTMPILFGMSQCVDFGRLIITEGQLDSLSVATAGFDNAVSVPNGAKGFTWLPNVWDWITKFQEIVVFGDWEHGKMSLLEELQARVPVKIKAVRPEDYLGEKDANDILRRFGPEAIRKAIENAEPPKIKAVRDLSTVETVDVNQLEKIRTGIDPLDRVTGGMIMGQLTLLTGKRGEGKSTFMSQIMANALNQNYSVFVYSGELANYHLKRWLDYQLAGTENLTASTNDWGDLVYSIPDEVIAKINAWYQGRAFVYDSNYVPDEKDELGSLPDIIEAVIRQYGVKLVCVDNLMTAMDAVDDQGNLYLAQSNFVGRLKKIAVKYDVAIILVAHPRKSNADFTNDDVSGSSDITNKVDVVMAYQRHDGDDYDSDLLVTKNRLFGRLVTAKDPIHLYYSDKTKRIFHGKAIYRYGWEKDHAPIEDHAFDWLLD